MPYTLQAKSGGVRWTPSPTVHDEYGPAADEAHAMWLHYQRKVDANPKHPPVTIRIVDTEKGVSFAPRTARRDVERAEDYECVPVSVDGIPALAKITHYYEGCPGCSGGMGPPLPPDPPEVEFELRDRRGYRAKWLEDRADWEDLERQVWREIQKEKRDE